MSEMVERVADALKITMGRAVLKGERPSVEELARAAIEAMKEPTEAMYDAGCESGDWGPGASLTGDDADPKTCWRSMIDAALKEKPE